MARPTARLRRARPAARAKAPAFLVFALLVMALAMLPGQAGAALPTSPAPTFIFVNDENGADDQPGQKDLSSQSVATPSPGVLWVSWKWDETGLSGGNTGDGCALFDNDGDSKVNFAICVTIQGKPALQAPVSPRVYTCGDGKVDRCTSTYTQISPINSACVTNTLASDPFHNGATDTQAICNIALSDVGGAGNGSTNLVNTCSYPSQTPTSDPSDCVLVPRDAFLRVAKVASGGSAVTFDFKHWTGSTAPGAATITTNGGTTSTAVAIRSDVTYSVSELAEAGWDLSGTPTCSGAGGSNGSFASGVISGIDASPDNVVTCTFTNTRQPGAIEITKVRTGTTTGVSGATFTIGNNTYTTDGTGKVCIPNLPLGSYTVTETVAPVGYGLASPASQTINVTSPGTCASGATSASFADPLLPGEITIHKSGVNNANLPGVTFTLYNNVSTSDGARNSSDTITGMSCITDANGNCTISNIPLGNYWIVETVPAGYIGASDQALTISRGTITERGDDQQTFSFTNSAAPGTIIINKTGKDGLPLAGAVFTLYRDLGLNAGVAGQSRDIPSIDTATGSTCTSQSDGSCTFSSVAPGDYWIVETTTPNGYVTAAEQQVEVLFGTTAGNGYTARPNVENVPAKGTIQITKTDDAGNALEGAEFTLYNNLDDKAAPRQDTGTDTVTTLKCTTDGNGLCDIEEIPLGDYWLVETAVPDHYDGAADQAVTVGLGTAANTGAVIPKTIENDRQHRVVVIVCHEGTDTLAPRKVTVDGVEKTSIGTGTPAEQKALCDTAGASFGDISGHSSVGVTVETGAGH